jgi:hypothetical protein
VTSPCIRCGRQVTDAESMYWTNDFGGAGGGRLCLKQEPCASIGQAAVDAARPKTMTGLSVLHPHGLPPEGDK